MAREILPNPYVGPRSFESSERQFFFGRDEEITILQAQVMARPASLLFSQSGAGKSSLLKAGLIPLLEGRQSTGSGPGARTYRKMHVLGVALVGGALPSGMQEQGTNPYVLRALLSLAQAAATEGQRAGESHPADLQRLAGQTLSKGLAPLLSPEAEGEVISTSGATLLVFDQFEELFTSPAGGWPEREVFFIQLVEALETYPALHVLLSMREDHIAELTPYAHLLPDALRHRYRLERLRGQAALDAVKLPAERAGRRFLRGVAEKMVSELARSQPGYQPPGVFPPGAAAGENNLSGFVEPVHLQIVCRQLWDRMNPRRKKIRFWDLEDFGDVDDTLGRFYEETLQKAVREARVSEEALRVWFDNQLITPARTRRPAYFHPASRATEGMPQDAVTILERAYIIRPEPRGTDIYYELVHDRLVEPILASNQNWRIRSHPPQIIHFDVYPNIVVQGQEVSLSWQTADADAVKIEPLGVTAGSTGYHTDTPQTSLDYTLVASRAGAFQMPRETRRVVVVQVDRRLPAQRIPHRRAPAQRNPYVGPRPYNEADRPLFFGRDREAIDLLKMVMDKPVTLLYGDAGVGKTSLIQARLVDDLRQQGYLVLPGGRVTPAPPVQALIQSLMQQLRTMGWRASDQDILQNTSSGLMEFLSWIYRSAPRSMGFGKQTNMVWIIDQLEEIFTSTGESREPREDFFGQLAEAILDHPGLKILLSIRSEHFARLDRYASLFPGSFQDHLVLEQLGPEPALAAVKEPAALAGRPFAPGAAEKLVDELRRPGAASGDQPAAPGEYVEPVQMQVVCFRLWEMMQPQARVIEMADVGALGSTEAVLNDFYQDALSRVVAETGIAERRLRLWFDERLITPNGTRALVQRGEKETAGLPNQAVDLLLNALILRGSAQRGLFFYELASDTLLRVVMRSNDAWREANELAWQRQAVIWTKHNRPETQLLSGEALRDAEAWAAKHPDEVTETEKTFLEVSRQARQRAELDRRIQAELRTDLSVYGWGMIAPHDCAPAILQALAPLLDHRRAQAEDNFKLFMGGEGYRPGEKASRFLERHGAVASQLAPEKMPLYLLLVGDPEAIPFEFQYGLNLQYATGRIAFSTPEEYHNYAKSVVMAESGQFSLPRRAVIFSPTNNNDPATRQATQNLAIPLFRSLQETLPDWEINGFIGNDATKSHLGQIMGGEYSPAFLFTASRALDPNPTIGLDKTGALVCQDWPGTMSQGPFLKDYYFSADDVSNDARLLGSIVFLWGPFTAGSPRSDSFYKESDKRQRREFAPKAFVSMLAQRLLAHPNGGALAVIGHVDTTYSFSYDQRTWTSGLAAISRSVDMLLHGATIGASAKSLNDRYAVLSSLMADELQRIFFNGIQMEYQEYDELQRLRTTFIDARNYIIIGDPAVRLALKERN